MKLQSEHFRSPNKSYDTYFIRKLAPYPIQSLYYHIMLVWYSWHHPCVDTNHLLYQRMPQPVFRSMKHSACSYPHSSMDGSDSAIVSNFVRPSTMVMAVNKGQHLGASPLLFFTI